MAFTYFSVDIRYKLRKCIFSLSQGKAYMTFFLNMRNQLHSNLGIGINDKKSILKQKCALKLLNSDPKIHIDPLK